MTEEWAPECRDLLSFALGEQLKMKTEIQYMFARQEVVERIICHRRTIRNALAKRKKRERAADVLASLRETWHSSETTPPEQSAAPNTQRASCRAIGSDRPSSWPSLNKASPRE